MHEKTRKLEENARMVGQCQGQCQENKVNVPQHREIASHICRREITGYSRLL